MKLRKTMIAYLAVAALGVSALAGCSPDTPGASDDPTTPAEDADEGDDDAAPAVGTEPLTIAKPDGAISTENNNPFNGDSAAAKYGYHNILFEKLGIVNFIGDNETTPWLAEDLVWNDDYTELRATPREGVTWSDGEEFTAEDIVFTFEMVSRPEMDTAALQFEGAEMDGDDVVLSFGESKFVKQGSVLNIPIVPKHIWENYEDPATDPVLEAIGTGPYVLTNFTSQSATLEARDDYWGGELAVPMLYFVSYNDNTALTTALANGDADWAQAFISNIEQAYLDHDPEHNNFWPAPVMAEALLYFNHQAKPFNDVAFREAVAWTVDRDLYAEVAREGASEPVWSTTGLPDAADQFILPEYADESYSVDIEKARGILEDAGYTWDGDALIDPDGDPVSFFIEVPQGWNDFVTGITLAADQIAEGLGADAQVRTPDVDTWWDAKTTGDFDAILHWTDTGTTPYDIYSNTMDERWLNEDGNADYNFGRYQNAEATEALDTYATASSDEERDEALATIQRIFVEEVPAVSMGTHGFLAQFNTRNYVGWPSEENPYAVGDPLQSSIVQILVNLEPAN